MGWLLALVDNGTLEEVGGARINLRDGVPSETFAQFDGVLAGTASIEGTQVAIFAQEPSYKGGSMGLNHTKRLQKLVAVALEKRIPIVGLFDSGGVRVQEGGASLEEASALVGLLLKARDEVPVISAVMGTISGAATYSAFMGHILLMIGGKSKMFVWGPGVVKAETGVDVGMDELGGTEVHSFNGTASLISSGEKECLGNVKRLIGYLDKKPGPSSGPGRPIHEGPRGLIEGTFDENTFIELKSSFAQNVITGIARLGGTTVGVVASNKGVLRGFMDVDSCRKLSRFGSMCNSLAIPMVTFLDCPGVYPAPEQERGGLVAASGEAIREFASTRGPKITVITGEAYGGIFVGFASKALGSRKVYAYPSAKVSVMGVAPYIEIFQRKKLDALKPEDRDAEVSRMGAEFLKQMDPAIGVRMGYIDEIIEPSQTRTKLLEALGS